MMRLIKNVLKSTIRIESTSCLLLNYLCFVVQYIHAGHGGVCVNCKLIIPVWLYRTVVCVVVLSMGTAVQSSAGHTHMGLISTW